MILQIAKHELLKHSRNGRSVLLLITTAALLLTSMTLSLRDYLLTNDHYEHNLLQSRLNWESQAEKDPHDAAHDGTYAIEPIHPLSMLDNGIQPFTGQVIHLGAHQRKQASLNQAKDHSGMFRFGELTPNLVLLYFFPLLLIFLGYNAFTEERERQTLRLLLTQGASMLRLTLGKWLALSILMGLMTLLFCLTAILYFRLAGIHDQVGLLEWFAFASAHFLYFFVFVNLTVLVSSLSKSSGKSLVTLLAAWILFTLIVPKLSTIVAGRLYPFPTLQTFQNNITEDQKRGLNGHNFWNEAAQDFQQKVLLEYNVETLEDLPVDYGGLLLAEGEKYESAIYTKHFNLLQAQYHDQRKIFRLGSLLSPFLPIRYISMGLARSDYNFQWRFEEQAEQYRVTLNTALNMNIAENAKGVTRYRADTALWAQIPKFSYQWEATDLIIQENTNELVSILSWGIISWILLLFVSRNRKAA